MEEDDFGSPWAASFRSRYEEFDEPIKADDKQMKENNDNFLAAVEKAKQRLAAGEKPENVFDRCADFDEGFARVRLNGKRNYIDCNINFLSDVWFDDCGFFYEGFAVVQLNSKFNHINSEGNYLSNKWFDWCGDFQDGFAAVKLNDKYYHLRKDGVLCDYDTKEPVKWRNNSMEQVDYKEKYEKVLEIASEWHKNGNEDAKHLIECIFPELKESEDEKVRKFINHELACLRATDEKGSDRYEELTNAIAWLENQGHDGKKWIYEDVYLKEKEQLFQDGIDEVLENPQKYGLEKQGEQKPIDKVEPKFKVGDWIINSEGMLRHIVEVDKTGYQTDKGWLTHDSYEREFHLWTIQDAKDGDVLVASDDSIFIFKEIMDGGCKYYFALGKDGKTIYVNDNFEHCWEFARYVKPATKEQRDLLFSKMREAGYEWDAEKKELIEQEDDKKPTAWSEEDEMMLNNIQNNLREFYVDKKGYPYVAEPDSPEMMEYNWLKSIKKRIKGE